MRSLIPITTLALLAPAAALATPLYSPVVSRIGDGTTPLESVTGVPADHVTAIQVYRPDLPNQSAPVAHQAYPTLQTYLGSYATGQLTNNPALADAAAHGLPYAGPNYVFSAGHTSFPYPLNSVTGYMTVTPTSASNPTLATTSADLGAALHTATGDDAPANFWIARGSGNTTSGGYIYANTNTLLSPNVDNANFIQIRQGQLYGSAVVTTGTVPFTSRFGIIQKIGTGTPTTGGNTVTPLFRTGELADLLNSNPAGAPLAFALLTDPARPTPSPDIPYNVAYVATPGVAGSVVPTGGIERWTFDPANLATNNGWSLAYTINDPNDLFGGFTGLAAQLDGPDVVLYATTTTTLGAGPLANSMNRLEQFTDPLAGSSAPATDATELTLATSPANTLFRGVALTVPEPATLTTSLLLCTLALPRRRPLRR